MAIIKVTFSEVDGKVVFRRFKVRNIEEVSFTTRKCEIREVGKRKWELDHFAPHTVRSRYVYRGQLWIDGKYEEAEEIIRDIYRARAQKILDMIAV